MDERKHYTDWDDSIYGTGPTQPPKSRGGMVALMLIIIIFLCGIVSILTMLNIRIFQEMAAKIPQETAAIDFIGTSTVPPAPASNPPSDIPPVEETTAPSVKSGGIQIHPSPESIANIPQEGGLSFQQIYENTIDSVVSISCSSLHSTSTGTGLILTEDGYIVTNAHVVENALYVTVKLTDDREFDATLVGSDEVSDLAVLHIEAEDLIPAAFGDSDILRVGDSVVAIGDPLGVDLRGTYTNGIISAINRDVAVDGRTMTLIQTNAALNSGNSGGPLLNCYGQVVGINTLKIGNFVDAAGVEGIGFAIPSSTVKLIVDQLIQQGYVSGRPTLGIKGESVSLFYQRYYMMPAGLFITELDPGSDAAAKGIQTDDILISINGKYISSMEDLNYVLYGCEVGETVETVIYRAGRQYLVSLTLSEAKG